MVWLQMGFSSPLLSHPGVGEWPTGGSPAAASRSLLGKAAGLSSRVARELNVLVCWLSGRYRKRHSRASLQGSSDKKKSKKEEGNRIIYIAPTISLTAKVEREELRCFGTNHHSLLHRCSPSCTNCTSHPSFFSNTCSSALFSSGAPCSQLLCPSTSNLTSTADGGVSASFTDAPPRDQQLQSSLEEIVPSQGDMMTHGALADKCGREPLVGRWYPGNWLTVHRHKILLSLYTIGLLLSSVMNSIYFKKMTDAMPNYSWFLSQLTTSVYIPVFFGIVLYTYLQGNLDDETTSFPKYRFLSIGSLDSLSGIMMILGGIHTSGTTQVVLQQAIIPITLLASVLILRARYHWLQYTGAVIIILGVLVAKSRDLHQHSSTTQDLLVFNIIFLLGGVPTALSSVYKEVAFSDVDLDVNYLQGWVALFQLLVGFFIVPLNTLSILGSQRITWSQMPAVLINGSKCLFTRTNCVVENCGGINQPPCDNCASSWIPVFTYLLFNIFYNLFTVLVIKHGSAALSILIATLKLPLTTFAFYSHYVMGENAVEPHVTDFYGLGILLLGLGGYRYGGALRRRAVLAEDDTEIKPVFANIIEAEPLFVRVHKQRGNPDYIRANYYYKLRVATPLQSPAIGAAHTFAQMTDSSVRYPSPSSPVHSLLTNMPENGSTPPPLRLSSRVGTPPGSISRNNMVTPVEGTGWKNIEDKDGAGWARRTGRFWAMGRRGRLGRLSLTGQEGVMPGEDDLSQMLLTTRPLRWSSMTHSPRASSQYHRKFEINPGTSTPTTQEHPNQPQMERGYRAEVDGGSAPPTVSVQVQESEGGEHYPGSGETDQDSCTTDYYSARTLRSSAASSTSVTPTRDESGEP